MVTKPRGKKSTGRAATLIPVDQDSVARQLTGMGLRAGFLKQEAPKQQDTQDDEDGDDENLN